MSLLCSSNAKEKPDGAQWKAELRAFANGNYKFGKLEKLGKGSRWEKELKYWGAPNHSNQGTLLWCIFAVHLRNYNDIIILL